MNHLHEPDYKRITLAMFLVVIVLLTWQYQVELPRRQQLAQTVTMQTQKQAEIKAQKEAELKAKENDSEYNPALTRADRLAASKRVTIKSDTLHGSIALKGARFDDLTLAKYKVTQEKNSPEVTLFSPNGEANAYFVQTGWVATDGVTVVPNANSVWKANTTTLSPTTPLTLSWNNGAGVTFIINVALDDSYMFTINQRVENNSAREITVSPYSYINRVYKDNELHNVILHNGPLGVLQGQLTEIAYEELREKGNKSFDNSTGWLGITDKYWLSALIPSSEGFKGNFSHYVSHEQPRYQVDYIANPQTIAKTESGTSTLRLFAGAKEISVLDTYAKGNAENGAAPIPLFDRAVDFGMLYFLTKPMFLMLNFFYALIGNFGLAIMMVTIVVKLCMFPLANKSYASMTQMRLLQPEMLKLREKYHDDHIALNKEMMALYKREKVNPASGCLPILIQMPVFFALYKVLFVTIEMRHAPFFGWLKDLSALDPTNMFNLFGLIPWAPPTWLHIGVLPLLMCITMIIQQKQQPAPTDPLQAKMMEILPYVFVYFFATFPAGLVLYWVWSNILSIIQSAFISRRYTKKNGHIVTVQ